VAKTVWWLCGLCGFANHPHAFRKDNTRCEQCGAAQQVEQRTSDAKGAVTVATAEDPQHLDYDPRSFRGL
jgi:hypothetical protein